MSNQGEVTLSRYISGLTLEKWCEFIEQRLESRGGLGRIFDKLSPTTHRELGMSLNATARYSREALDEFCEAVSEVFHGPQIGLHLGAYSCESSYHIIENILAVARGDPVALLKDCIRVIHSLYSPEGSIQFIQEGAGEGTLTYDGWPHNEVSCYSNAGYTKKCLELIGTKRVEVGSVEHSKDVNRACRIHIRWEPGRRS